MKTAQPQKRTDAVTTPPLTQVGMSSLPTLTADEKNNIAMFAISIAGEVVMQTILRGMNVTRTEANKIVEKGAESVTVSEAQDGREIHISYSSMGLMRIAPFYAALPATLRISGIQNQIAQQLQNTAVGMGRTFVFKERF